MFAALIDLGGGEVRAASEHQRAGGEARPVETWLAFEGSEPLPADVNVLRSWVVRGVRLFGVVHAQHTELAQSSGEKEDGSGLTERGEAFVRAVYAAGGIVDVSHASDSATAEILAIARSLQRPVVATHSNARALAPHARNLNGFDDPARYYFGVRAQELNLAEAALLVGMLPEPNNRDPLRHPAEALRGGASVLQGMAEQGMVTEAQAATAEAELKRRRRLT